MKQFDLQLALAGAKVQTRDGRTVTDIKVVRDALPRTKEDVRRMWVYIQGIRGTIHNFSGYHEYPFYHDGTAHKYLGDDSADLFMVDEGN